MLIHFYAFHNFYQREITFMTSERSNLFPERAVIYWTEKQNNNELLSFTSYLFS